MGWLTSWYMKRFGLHDMGNGRCPQCPDHWPIEHKNCGGLFHTKFGLNDGITSRVASCDKCNQMLKLFAAGNLGSPEEARRLERMILTQATSETQGDGFDRRQ
jgi:hypothetical protein